jgi:hypothetical protein
MAESVRPSRGGFTRPFGCGWFIREFLLGNGPYDTPRIDSNVGKPQSDVFYYYKNTLRLITAQEKATKLEEKQAQRQGRAIDPDNIEKLAQQYLERLPYKAWGCRYHSFVVYFSNLKRLDWVEVTGREEHSSFQDNYTEGQPKTYYRLTDKGRGASDDEWRNPHGTLYGETKLR